MHPPKTNGGIFFVGAGDTNDSSATQKNNPTAENFQLDTMTTVALSCSSGTHPMFVPTTTIATKYHTATAAFYNAMRGHSHRRWLAPLLRHLSSATVIWCHFEVEHKQKGTELYGSDYCCRSQRWVTDYWLLLSNSIDLAWTSSQCPGHPLLY